MVSVRKSLNNLKKDGAHGAGWLTGQAIEIIKLAVSESKARSPVKLAEELNNVVDELIKARPGMVSIANYATRFREELKIVVAQSKTTEGFKKKCATIATSLIKHHEKSSLGEARNAAKIILNRSIVMTCSYSSAVCRTLELAKKKGTDFKVLVVESKSNGISYGNMTVSNLKRSKISAQLVPDDHIRWHASRADVVLLGADTISLHGWMLNGTPSFELVRIAGRRNIPVYVVCGLSKFDVQGMLTGLHEPEPGFDIIPLDLVTGIATESAMSKPDDIHSLTMEDIFRSTRARPD